MAGPSRVEGRRGEAREPQISTRTPTYAAMVLVTEMGPIGSPFPDAANRSPITSWPEWQSIYGGFTANAQNGPLAAKNFFDEGGQFLFTSRAVHTTTPGDPTTKTSAKATLDLNTGNVAATPGFVLGTETEPFELDHNDDFEIAIDTVSGPGTVATATILATAPTRDSVDGPFVLVDGMVLNVTINTTAVVFTFNTASFANIAAATSAEVAAVMNAKLASLNPSVRAVASPNGLKARLETTWLGTGASINVTGGTANAILQYTTGLLNGTGNVADVDAVTVAELETIFEAANADCVVTNVGGAVKVASNTTGPNSSAQITGTGSTAAALTELGFDTALHPGGAAGTQPTLRVEGRWDGSYGNELSPRVSAPSSGETGRFDFAILRGGRVVESWKDASMDQADGNYVETLVNKGVGSQKASRLVMVEDLDATFDSPDDLPAVGTFGPLTGGDDGLASLADVDFYGGETVNGATGLYAFNELDRIDIVAVPGRCTASVHGQILTWIEVYREGRTYAVVAVPEGLTVAEARTYVTSTAFLKESTEIASIYGPWVRVDNPNPTIFGKDATVITCPEGAIVGMFCRVDSGKEGGAFEHPSNALGVLGTVRGVEHGEYEDARKRGLAFDDFINAIRVQKGKRPYVDGARTLRSTGPFPTVGESRGVMLVMNNFVEAWDILRNAAIRDSLYVRLATSANVYLGRLTKAQCFRTTIPEQAFYVDFGPGLNTPDVVEAREVIGMIGLNTAPPAEFIFFTVVPFAGLAEQFAQQAAAAASGVT